MTITSVAGGFPSSQTYLEVKMLETAMAVENGADEIDVVISLGEMLSGEYDLMGNEIETLRNEVGDDVVLKVILELGRAGPARADSPGSRDSDGGRSRFHQDLDRQGGRVGDARGGCRAVHGDPASSPSGQGRRVGFKAAGGRFRRLQDAVLCSTIVERILGPQWLTPALFRIGASSLAGNLLNAIVGREENYF